MYFWHTLILRTLPSLLLTALSAVTFSAAAQRTAKVSARYQFIVTDNDNITLREAKIKCVELAKAEALKNEFGTMIVSDFINSERVENDELSSIYIMDTSSSVKGEWLGDEREPEISVEAVDGDLIFTAEVWGTAREIIRASTELKWEILKDNDGKKNTADTFDSGERFFIKFKSPINGYMAVYLVAGDDETACLLPYRKDSSGYFPVKAGKEYILFDKTIDPAASYYKLSTNHLQEMNQIVVVFSPNQFTKCLDTSSDSRRPNHLSHRDFAKWLLKSQRADKDMIVNRKWITINGTEN